MFNKVAIKYYNNVSSPKIAIMTICNIYKITGNFKSKIVM